MTTEAEKTISNNNLETVVTSIKSLDEALKHDFISERDHAKHVLELVKIKSPSSDTRMNAIILYEQSKRR